MESTTRAGSVGQEIDIPGFTKVQVALHMIKTKLAFLFLRHSPHLLCGFSSEDMPAAPFLQLEIRESTWTPQSTH